MFIGQAFAIVTGVAFREMKWRLRRGVRAERGNVDKLAYVFSRAGLEQGLWALDMQPPKIIAARRLKNTYGVDDGIGPAETRAPVLHTVFGEVAGKNRYAWEEPLKTLYIAAAWHDLMASLLKSEGGTAPNKTACASNENLHVRRLLRRRMQACVTEVLRRRNRLGLF
jgi:hypothetical protein